MERLASQGEHGQSGVPLSARQQPDVLPNVGVQPAALAGGLDVAARGLGSWGGLRRRTASQKRRCRKWAPPPGCAQPAHRDREAGCDPALGMGA
jgi:hypothetical protein